MTKIATLQGLSISAMVLFASMNTALGGGYPRGVIKTQYENVSVEVLVQEFSVSNPCQAPEAWGWGAEGQCPDTGIDSVRVTIDERAVFVPLSAFSDLGNPRNISVQSRDGGKRYIVGIVGGDAATSYAAELTLEHGLLVERSVHHGEFPDEVWERTLYRYNTGETNQ